MRKPKVRRRHDAEETRQALLQAAEKHFSEHGFAAANVREIARIADATNPLINHYFGSKEGLYSAVQQVIDQHQLDCLEEVLSEFGDQPSPPDAMLRILLSSYRRNPTLPRLVAWWLLERGTVTDWPGRRGTADRMRAIMADCFARGVLRKRKQPFDLLLAQWACLALGWTLMKNTVRERYEELGLPTDQLDEEFLAQASDAYLTGVQPRGEKDKTKVELKRAGALLAKALLKSERPLTAGERKAAALFTS